jgi:AraC family transcriptional regulator of adaptative response / DNA-3-methyladenine glycosylase II
VTSENRQSKLATHGSIVRVMTSQRELQYRAIQARDRRFDGRLFVAVRTTGVYCRPICPARTPKLENIVFYSTAAAAHEAGFRPCLRCRPEVSPQFAAWHGTSRTVTRALALIGEGALDGGDGDFERFAARLGVGERHLRRLFQEHVGASPIAVLQARRFLFAKQLVHETQMSMTDVALASGFGSVRRFNESFRSRYGRPPSTLRRRRSPATGSETGPSGIRISLDYMPPFDWPGMHAFFAGRAIPGVEVADERGYRRTIQLAGRQGTIEIAPAKRRDALAVTIRFPDLEHLPVIVSRLRRMFDLAADTTVIGAHLAEDPHLASLVAARPGLRVPGNWDGFELAVRAVLGQQVSVRAARALAARLTAASGEPLCDALSSAGEPSRLFPSAERLARLDPTKLGMPVARGRTLVALAEAALDDPRLLEGGATLEQSIARLRQIRGIGDWTAHYIALRALREPDAFPASDVALLRAMPPAGGRRVNPRELLARAESWRPWRGYAAQHLWAADGASSVERIRRLPNGPEIQP